MNVLSPLRKVHGVPAAEFVGLAPGKTYYAYDPDTIPIGRERN